MYTLNRISPTFFEIKSTDGQVIAKGSFDQVKSIGQAHGFSDLDFAKSQMDQNNHNSASFGIYRSFIYSYTDNNTFKLVH